MTGHKNTLSRRSFVAGSAAVAATLAGAASLAMPQSEAYAVTAAQKQAEAQEALKKLDSMQQQLDIASADYYTAVDEQKAAQDRMDEAQVKIDETQARIEEVQEQIGVRVRSMYRTGSSSFIDMLLGSTSYRAFTSNWQFLNEMNDSDAAMVEESKQLKSQVEAEKAVYTEQERVAEEKARTAEEVKAQAEALVKEVQATYDSLSAEAAALVEQERQAAEEAARREAEAAEAARQQAAASSSNSSSGGGSGSGSGSNSSSNTNNNKNQTVPGGTVVERAYAHLGLPYSWGATGPNSFDCSGFVSMCLTGKYGVRLGTTYTFMGWTRVSDPQPGDVCTNSHHCGIYVGGGQMVHAPRTGDVVKVSSVHSDMIFVRY